MRHLLVIANHTVLDAPLFDALRDEASGGPIRVTLLVPAIDAAQSAMVWDEQRTWNDAEARMLDATARIAALGVEVTGRVGGHDALAAALDVVREQRFDKIVVSTLPPGLSRWLGMDLPSRLARATNLPVRHVVSTLAAAPA